MSCPVYRKSASVAVPILPPYIYTSPCNSTKSNSQRGDGTEPVVSTSVHFPLNQLLHIYRFQLFSWSFDIMHKTKGDVQLVVPDRDDDAFIRIIESISHIVNVFAISSLCRIVMCGTRSSLHRSMSAEVEIVMIFL